MNQELILILSSISKSKLWCNCYPIACTGVHCFHCVLYEDIQPSMYIAKILKIGERIL
ncbi:hypothetical protein CPT_Pollock11 [Escherichia phage Pollock]|uniref:Uncharacterized protein n=1 Tax=Escherichia phage Pollock TaxID=1540097 RepID=A0A0A0YW49_9CAUD|nr:hypothetical protein ACQ44_gp11 [Escherichia phage Pollock]AIX12370.1 hypothetical protein CPT_Pollock11 [Escherichia phage Pollock]